VNRSLSLLVLAGLTLTAPEAQAQEETPGFVRTVVPTRPWCLLWNKREYLFRVDASGSLRTPGTTEFAAIDASFDAWRALSRTCSDFAFTRGPDLQNPRVGYDKESKVNENVFTTFGGTAAQTAQLVHADDVNHRHRCLDSHPVRQRRVCCGGVHVVPVVVMCHQLRQRRRLPQHLVDQEHHAIEVQLPQLPQPGA